MDKKSYFFHKNLLEMFASAADAKQTNQTKRTKHKKTNEGQSRIQKKKICHI